VRIRSRVIGLLSLGVLPLALALVFCARPASAQRRGGGMVGGGMREGGMPGDGMRGGGMRDSGGFRPPMARPQPQFRGGFQLGLGGRWWDERKSTKSLSLRPDQKQRMDSIFEANKPTLINLYTNLQREEAHLASLPPGDLQDETKVFAAIDRVAQAREDLEKETAHYLIQIRGQLDPQQLQSLDRQIASSR
jgi:Spy/CpxP family protein refolding chaperone